MALGDLTERNSAFSKALPGLQLAVDSHSLTAFKTCPRWYYYTIVCGLQPGRESVHLIFGLLVHKAHETYHQMRAQEKGHEEALEAAVEELLISTWSRSLRRPWLSDDPNKNRLTLLRTVIWYLDRWRDDPLKTVLLASGEAAVELHFAVPFGFTSERGEAFLACGWLDRLASLEGAIYIPDIKTSKNTISQAWFDKFTPFNQFTFYTFAGRVAFAKEAEGVILDGVQVAVGFSRFERQLVPRPSGVVEEWHQAVGSKWLPEMERAARRGSGLEARGLLAESGWEMNDTACDRYGGCPARHVCGRSPAAREQWLQRDFRRKIWDPLKERADI